MVLWLLWSNDRRSFDREGGAHKFRGQLAHFFFVSRLVLVAVVFKSFLPSIANLHSSPRPSKLFSWALRSLSPTTETSLSHCQCRRYAINVLRFLAASGWNVKMARHSTSSSDWRSSSLWKALISSRSAGLFLYLFWYTKWTNLGRIVRGHWGTGHSNDPSTLSHGCKACDLTHP